MIRTLLIALLVGSCAPPVLADEIRGGDVSFLESVEAGRGSVEFGAETDALAILSQHGLNTARLRVWHTTSEPHGSLTATLRLARRARDLKMDVLLDLHYSDTWADPATQTPPAAWAGLAYPALVESVYAHTRDVVSALRGQGTPPRWVQIGNEISGGFLWNTGRVGGAFDTQDQWWRLAGLVEAAVGGIHEAAADGPMPRVIIHTDHGGDLAAATWFHDGLVARAVPYDVIGLSYYPWWHGSLTDLETTVHGLADRYGKPILIAETGYPWSLAGFDRTHNIVGTEDQLLPGFPATPRGQSEFLGEVRRIVAGAPDSLGLGVVYWAPDWIAAPGFGSAWENVALFHPTGSPLPGLAALGRQNISGIQGDGPAKTPRTRPRASSGASSKP